MAGQTSQSAKVPLLGHARRLHIEQHQCCLHVNGIQRPPTAVLAEDSLGSNPDGSTVPVQVGLNKEYL
jgi:hypothetical protein